MRKSISKGLDISDGVVYGIGTCKDTDVVIPESSAEGESITDISSCAFYCCTSLTSIIIPENISYIGASAFKGCSSLMSVKISGDITMIAHSLFADCKSIINIKIPDNVQTICNCAFSDCESLKEIFIPVNVFSIGNEAFLNCSKLESITFNGTKAQWRQIEKGKGWDKGSGNYTIFCADGSIKKSKALSGSYYE